MLYFFFANQFLKSCYHERWFNLYKNGISGRGKKVLECQPPITM